MSSSIGKPFMIYLILKAKLLRLAKTPLIQLILGVDLTPFFLFLSLKLLGYEWSWETLIASLGLWIVITELFNHVRGVAYELRGKGG